MRWKAWQPTASPVELSRIAKNSASFDCALAAISDALQAGVDDEVVAGAQSRSVYQQFIADPKAVQAMMLSRLPKR